jgi:site-specific recombinase XerD
MASVHSHPLSSFWQASISIWDAKAGRMKRTFRTTKVPVTEDQGKALLVAQELEVAGRPGQVHVPREAFHRQLASIMRLAGAEVPLKATTWSEFSASWLKEQHLRPGSLKGYKRQVAEFGSWLGSRSSDDLRRISVEDISSYNSFLKGKMGGHSVGHYMARLRTIFHRAHALGYIDADPASLVKIRVEKAGRRRPFTMEEVQLLLAHLEHPERRKFRVPVLFGLYYGMRLSDAISRSHEEIQNGCITFKVQKTGSIISLPLVGELVSLSGKGPISPGIAAVTMSRRFRGFVKDCGIQVVRRAAFDGGEEFGDVTFHSLRHTSATWLAEAGVDMKVRQLILGHSTAAMAVHYTHSSLASIKAALESVHGSPNPPASSAKHGSAG